MTIRPDDDHYPTPPEAVRALLSVEAFGGGIWEPCAGDGAMAAVLREAGYTVRATTIGEGRHDRDFPKHRVVGGIDFLTTSEASHPNIITNPPYGRPRDIAEAIIRHAIGLGPVKMALLMNVKFLAGSKRRVGLWAEYPPARVWVFADRITMYPAGYQGPKGTTTETFAWYVWERPFLSRPPVIGWLDSSDHRGVAA